LVSALSKGGRHDSGAIQERFQERFQEQIRNDFRSDSETISGLLAQLPDSNRFCQG